MNNSKPNTCPYCYAALQSPARFCPACGRELADAAAADPTDGFIQAQPQVDKRNPEMTGVIVGAVILGLGIILFLWPWISGMDMMMGGYAMQCLSGFGAMFGGLVLLFWWQRANSMKKILAGQEILAHWQYPLADNERHARQELQERLGYNKMIYLIMLFFAVLFGVIFFVIPAIQGDIHPVVVLLWFGFFAFLALVAWGVPQLEYRQALRSGGDVYITPECVYIYGAMQSWKQPFTSLRKVTYETGKNGSYLKFAIRYLSRTSLSGRETRITTVPVPLDQEDAAQRVVSYFENRK